MWGWLTLGAVRSPPGPVHHHRQPSRRGFRPDVLQRVTFGPGLAGNALDGLPFLFNNVIDKRYIEGGSRIGRAVHVAESPAGPS